mmetsp:Transcript_17666/g.48018  ORF Transcript_17666/g.48018 Transcript_17666/m.48018 type:complete len:362 (-) Transcript_17666:101-1186(-)
MFTTRFCRCFCSSEQSDLRVPEIDVCSPHSPRLNTVPDVKPVKPGGSGKPLTEDQAANPVSYSTSLSQPLLGVPIREDGLWLLSVENDSVREMSKIVLSLYINGFSFVYKEKERAFSLSPFTLVRPCRFYDDKRGLNVSNFKCFKVALFACGALLYFAVGPHESDEKPADEERQRWAVDISCAVQLVTQSLFPSYTISCEPLEAVSKTQGRLMAGYLIAGPTPHSAVLLFCELHPQSRGQARLALYDTEGCGCLVRDIIITEESACVEKVGLNCSCFCIGEHLFAARTPEERRLWLRVISNLKAKLRNRAPSPTDLELRQYRSAIKDHLRRAGVAAVQALGEQPPEPLLAPVATEVPDGQP